MKAAQVRRREAEERREARAARTPMQQLATLDHRLGHNCGAGKERARLMRDAVTAARLGMQP